MNELVQLLLVAIGSGGIGSAATAWFGARSARHGTDRTVDADLQKHWTETTLGLVERLEALLKDALAENSALRPLKAHFEEALNHLHNLVEAAKDGSDEELRASIRQASAFLRRMRPDAQAKGEQREEVQRAVSAERVKRDARRGKTD